MESKKIKILYEGLSDNLGGIENYIYNLYKNIDKNLFEISFLVDKGLKIAYYEEYNKDNVKIYEVENRKKNYFKYLKELKKIYKENDFDFIHINIMSYSLFERILYACKYSSAKVIVHSHNGGFSKDTKYKKTMFLDKVGRFFLKKYFNSFIKVACSDKAGKFAFCNDDYLVFKNGVDIDKFSYNELNRKKVRRKLNVDDDEILFGLVAMFNDFKNHDFLIDIFYEYLKLNKKSRLILVGEGYLKDYIINKVNTLNIQNKVIFLGKRLDVNDILSGLDIYIMPSKSEGISLSLIEAQVNGLKCYTSTGVDINSNVTGNVDFLSLTDGAKKWAEHIYNSDIIRDNEVLNKIPSEFDYKECYKRVFDYYINNLK